MSILPHSRLLLTVILLLALLLRTIPLTYSHFWDETVYLQNAKVILEGRTNYDELDVRPPFLSVLYALGFAIWDNVYVANVIQGVATTLVVLFAFLYVRGAFGNYAAFFSAFLFAFTPYLVDRSHELLSGMPALVLMLAAMWLFDKPGIRYAVLAGVVYALAIQTRFTSLFFIFYFAIELTLSPKKLRSLALLLGGAAVAITPYLLWVKWNYGSFLFPFVMARRIVTEWTAPVPAVFYWNALTEIFPYSLWLFFGIGTLLPIARWVVCRREGEASALLPPVTDFSNQTKRQIVLLLWGVAFFFYMVAIPHKEVRYLLPLAIPVVIISALGLATLYLWFERQTIPVRFVGILLGVALAIANYGTPFQKLTGPYVDRSEGEVVEIARYLHRISTPADTIYAAHEFPVLAFYSERRTVSLLPIQEKFDYAWSSIINQPGFLVYFHPEKIKEIHSKNPSLKPDQRFIENCPTIRVVRVFPIATVYRFF